ncbi:MAG: hypothetical protein RLZZ583_628 [Pseudomonadota bacterium]
MQLSTSEISELIKSRLENFSTTAEDRRYRAYSRIVKCDVW